MKEKLGLAWAWIVIAMFAGLMLYSFAFVTGEILKPESRIGLVIVGLFLIFLMWKVFTSDYEKRTRVYFAKKDSLKIEEKNVKIKNKTTENNNLYLQNYPGLYAAMVVSKTEFLGDMFPLIHVYLVNNTNVHYPSVKVLTGASASIDDDLMETGKKVSEPVALAPHSAIKVGGSDIGEDSSVWFDVDLTDEADYCRYFRFSLPKRYNWDRYASKVLPFIGEEGLVLPLTARNTGDIDSYVRESSLAPRYFEHKDGKMVQQK